MTTTTFGLDVFRRELLKGSTETLILSLLAGQEMYGYQLAKEMEKKSGGYFHLKEGTLYPALHRLERDGLIKGHWELSQSGQSRRYYHVSTRGMDRLDAMLAEWNTFSDAVNRIARPVSLPAYVA